MERCSTSLITMEMHVKTTVSQYIKTHIHLTSTQIATTERRKEKHVLARIWRKWDPDGNVNDAATVENRLAVPQKINTELPHDSAISLEVQLIFITWGFCIFKLAHIYLWPHNNPLGASAGIRHACAGGKWEPRWGWAGDSLTVNMCSFHRLCCPLCSHLRALPW